MSERETDMGQPASCDDERVHYGAGNVVAVETPVGELRIYDQQGRDQVVNTVVAGGWHAFETPMPRWFLACLPMVNGAVFDVGANTGYYTLLALMVRKDIHVHAFEAYCPIAELLRRNLDLNRVAQRVEVVDEAVTDRVGEAVLHIPDDSHGTVEGSATLDSTFKKVFQEHLPIRTTTVDVHASSAHVRRVGLIKIDVEGADHAVLAGASETLLTSRPFVFLEALPGLAAVAPLTAMLRRHHYLDVGLRSNRLMISDELIEPDDWMGANHLFVPAERLRQVLTVLRPLVDR